MTNTHQNNSSFHIEESKGKERQEAFRVANTTAKGKVCLLKTFGID